MSLIDFTARNLKKRELEDRIKQAQDVIDHAASQKDGWSLQEIAQFVMDDAFQDILEHLKWRPGHAPKKRLTPEQRQNIQQTVYARVQQRIKAEQDAKTSDLFPEFEAEYDISRVTFSQLLSAMVKDNFLSAEKVGREYRFQTGSKQLSDAETGE